MQRKIKTILAPVIIIATFAGFAFYARTHPVIIDQLLDTPPLTAAAIIGLYAVWLVALMGVLYGGLALYNRKLDRQENFYVNAYSSIVNFFGPGQSGPAVRAAYLKLKHGVSVKQYAFATLVYYGFYSLISGVIIAVAALPWWISIIVAASGTLMCLLLISFLRKRKANLFTNTGSTAMKPVLIIGAFTLMQVVLQVIIYYIELRSVGTGATIGQTLVYTGAANFALFVSLTPGAIGFREAFLVFSQRLHDISNEAIVAANILDRTIYITFLGLLFVAVLVLRTRSRFAKLAKAIETK